MKFSQLWKHNHNLSFKLRSHNVEFCARCSSIAIGFIFWMIMILVFSGIEILVYRQSLFVILILCFLLTLPLVIFWMLQNLGKYHNTNLQRAFSGILLSASLAIFALRQDILIYTLPFALGWQGTVLAFGYRYRRNREVTWDCQSCIGTESLF